MNKKLAAKIISSIAILGLACFLIGCYTCNYIDENRNDVEINWSKDKINIINKISNIIIHRNYINVVIPDGAATGLPKEVGTRTRSGFVRESEDTISYMMDDGSKLLFDYYDSKFDKKYHAAITRIHYEYKNYNEYPYMNYDNHHKNGISDLTLGFSNTRDFDQLITPAHKKSGIHYLSGGTNISYLSPKREESIVVAEYLCRVMIDAGLLDNERMDRNLRMFGQLNKT